MALLALPGCIERRPDPAAASTAPVEIQLPLGVDEVRGRLGALFVEGLAVRPPHPGSPGAAGDWLACFTLFDRPSPGSPGPGGQPVFPTDESLRAGRAAGDPAMDRYLSLSAPARAHDVFLYNARGCAWASEVRAEGRPLRFSCDFILHLEGTGGHAARIEALEVRPQAVLGSHLGLTAHGLGVGWVETSRGVPATRRDRVELLARIGRALEHP